MGWLRFAVILGSLAAACSSGGSAGSGVAGARAGAGGGGHTDGVANAAGAGRGGGGQSSGGHAGADSGTSGVSGGGEVGGEVFDAGPAVLNPDLDFLDEDLIARAAVALIACYNDDGFFLTLTFMRGMQDEFSYRDRGPFLECVAAVTTGCDGLMECYGVSALQGSETCDTCQGDVAVYCGADGPYLQDCSKTGAICQAGRCVKEGTVSCEYATFDANCDDEGRPIDCDDTVTVGPPCHAFGLACGVESAFAINSYCEGTGEPCDLVSEFELALDPVGAGCDGNVLNACVYGRTDNIDCRNLGPDFSCQSHADGYFCGTASECDPRTYEYTCQGSAVTFCNAGKLTTVDCAEFGFTQCVEGLRSGICE